MTNIVYPKVIDWKAPHKNIVMTVALPALRSERIIWLALESLRRQKDIDFEWELIIMEEYGKSKEVVNKFVGKLPGCKRITHYSVDPKIHGIKEGRYRGRFILLDKWIEIAKRSTPTSKVYVLHAADCYSSPKRLSIHYRHFKNKDCYFSTQPKGLFFNLVNKKMIFYNGYRIDFRNKRFFTGNHLNMALRTEDMLKIKHELIFKGIDGYIRRSLRQIHRINPKTKKHIFTDNEIDPENWKYSIDTDGMNNISHKRRMYYLKPRRQYYPYKKKNVFGYKGIRSYIPKNVMNFISGFNKKKPIQVNKVIHTDKNPKTSINLIKMDKIWKRNKKFKTNKIWKKTKRLKRHRYRQIQANK